MRLLRPNGRLYQQKAVYWACTGQTDSFSKLVYNDPEVVVLRWEDQTRTYLDKTGQEKTSKAIIYPQFDPIDESFFWLSSFLKKDSDDQVLAELTQLIADQGSRATLNQPYKIQGAWRIQRFDRIPTRKATQILRIAYL